jgi:predicted polyphosphate/ATP-dependent NAD kinase
MNPRGQVIRVGLVINPVAGLGGPAGLKGSDGEDIQQEALRRGAIPHSTDRAVSFLRELVRLNVRHELVCGPGPLGEDATREAGLGRSAVVVPVAVTGTTTASHTRAVVTELSALELDVITFVGGDGTARDVAACLDPDDVVLGIPAGVKMQSGVFARSPESAAALVAQLAQDRASTSTAEIVDIDEQARRQGIISSTLYGRVKVLGSGRQVQGGKLGSRPESRDSLAGLAKECHTRMDRDALCLLGPGTTVSAVANGLNLKSTLLGVDVVHRGRVIAADCSAAQLHDLTRGQRIQVVLSPIGGQGFLFGRGNQQLDAQILHQLDPQDVFIVCTPEKLGELGGGPLYVDVEDAVLRSKFTGLRRIITGFRQEAVVQLVAA